MDQISTPHFNHLIYNCRKGHKQSQKALYNLIAPDMYDLVKSKAYSSADADEIMINGFIYLFNHLNTYNPKVDFYDWAGYIFINATNEYNRKHNKVNLLTLSDSFVSYLKLQWKSLVPGYYH